MPDMHAVESTNIESIGYNQFTKELHVRFKGRPIVYVYQDVPMPHFEDLMRSESKGQYLSAHIKGIYAFTKFEVVAVEPIPADVGTEQFVKGRDHLDKYILGEEHEHTPLEKHILGEEHEHAPNEPQDLLTLTMTRPIFEALQEMLAGHGTNNMTLTETSPGVVQLEVIVLHDEADHPFHDEQCGD